MCLHKLKNFTVTQSHGWQVFVKMSGKLYLYNSSDGPVPVGKWQRDKFRISKRWIYINYISDLKYKKGYHIFLNEEDAKNYCPSSKSHCIKKVRFKGVLARGLQEITTKGRTQQVRVVVCHKRFIERD